MTNRVVNLNQREIIKFYWVTAHLQTFRMRWCSQALDPPLYRLPENRQSQESELLVE